MGGGSQGYCKPCRAEYQRTYYRNRPKATEARSTTRKAGPVYTGSVCSICSEGIPGYNPQNLLLKITGSNGIGEEEIVCSRCYAFTRYGVEVLDDDAIVRIIRALVALRHQQGKIGVQVFEEPLVEFGFLKGNMLAGEEPVRVGVWAHSRKEALEIFEGRQKPYENYSEIFYPTRQIEN
jgi:hypothetical protein